MCGASHIRDTSNPSNESTWVLRYILFLRWMYCSNIFFYRVNSYLSFSVTNYTVQHLCIVTTQSKSNTIHWRQREYKKIIPSKSIHVSRWQCILWLFLRTATTHMSPFLREIIVYFVNVLWPNTKKTIKTILHRRFQHVVRQREPFIVTSAWRHEAPTFSYHLHRINVQQ